MTFLERSSSSWSPSNYYKEGKQAEEDATVSSQLHFHLPSHPPLLIQSETAQLLLSSQIAVVASEKERKKILST